MGLCQSCNGGTTAPSTSLKVPGRGSVGPPTAAIVKPGKCAISNEWTAVELASKVNLTHNVMLLTFNLDDILQPLGLATCAYLLCKGLEPDSEDTFVRPYTPVSTNALLGKFQLMVKVYAGGKMSRFLDSLSIGSSVDFRHTSMNVKIQYPFNKKYLTLLVGGSGITPMIQVLHAVLGTPGDTTEVTLIYANRTQKDIVFRDMLEEWSQQHPRFVIQHILSAGADDPTWLGATGRITGEFIAKHSQPPSEDVLVMVCGPPSMYDTFCGPREEREVTGVLSSMGYTANQVFKF